MGKIEKLNRDIQKLEDKITLLEYEIDEAKGRLGDKIITKADFTTLKHKNQLKIRDFRTAIRRKEKARLHHEKKIKEKAEKKRKKAEGD